LEERDTLQLRLSNALRANEELRARMRTSVIASVGKTAEQSQSRQEASQHTVAPSGNTVAEEPHEDLQALANK